MENVKHCVLTSSNKGHQKALCAWEEEKGLTWHLHSEEGKDFDDKHRNPADGIREHDEKEAVGHSHLSLDAAPHFGSVQGCSLNGAEHDTVGKDDDEKRQQVHTCWEKHSS